MAASWTPLTGTAHSVALEVLRHGPLARSELARRLGLSRGSLTRLARPLLDSGLLVEAVGSTGAGTRPLDVVATSHHFVGVKLTADTAYAVATTMRAEVVASQTRPLPGTEPATVAATLRDLVDDLVVDLPGVTAVGVSLGGQVEDHDVVTSARYLGWEQVAFSTLLRERLRLPVVVDNDLLSLTRAEQWFGAARTCERFAVITIGEGVGYGLVVHERLVEGHDAGVGLLGHFPLDPLGPVCPLGHQGCADSMLTTSAVVRRTSVALGRPVDYDECLDLAAAGDPAARRVVDDAARALGRLVAAAGNLTMPQMVVLGGEGVRLAQVGAAALEEGVRRDRDPRADPLPVRVHPAGFSEWARGAAVTAIQAFVLGPAAS